MIQSETQTPGTFANNAAVGSWNWANVANAGANDATYATCTPLGGGVTRYLEGTDCSFSDMPSNAVIRGIKLRIDRKDSAGTTVDNSVRLVQDGGIAGDDKASAATWPTSDAYAEYGSNSDLWGLTWTVAQIKASDFGAVISATIGAGVTASIDHMEIIVYYTVLAKGMYQYRRRRVR